MQEKTLEALARLSLLLRIDARTKRLEAAEAAALASPEVAALSSALQQQAAAYLEKRSRQGEEGEETLAAQKQLAQAKKAFDANPLVWEYNLAYAAIRRLYAAIDEAILGPYREKRRCLGK